MNMGQRYVQLDNTYSFNSNGSATLHVSHLPPNPAILTPGPALLFVVVNGIPSTGVFVMVGTGTLGKQPTKPKQALPASTGGDAGATWNAGNQPVNTVRAASPTTTGGSGSSTSTSTPKSASSRVGVEFIGIMVVGVTALLLV